MSQSTDDQFEGRVHEVKGAIKQTAGQLLGSPNLEAEGYAEALTGKLQTKVSQVEKATGK